MAKDEVRPLSDESKTALEEVQRGKPRKFVMISKADIVSLVVFKKGNFDKATKEAKAAGKGNVSFGVVNGKGQDIRFVLARADGFDSAPVKTVILRSFLKDQAEIKSQALFEIVDAIPLVLDEGDPLVARFLALQERALAACDKHPERAAELNTLCRQIGSHLDQDQPEPATAKLDELETLLGTLTGNVPPAPPPPTQPASLAGKLVEAVRRFKPLIEQAIVAHPDRKAELIAAITQIGRDIKTEQFDAARAGTLGLGKLLQSLGAAAAPPPPVATSVAIDGAAWQQAKSAWRDANDEVDAQIDKLQTHCRTSGNSLLEQLAEFGLNAVTKDIKVRFQAALFEFDQTPVAAAATALRNEVDRYLSFLAGDAAVRLFDENVLGVPVSIRATLTPPLTELGKALKPYA